MKKTGIFAFLLSIITPFVLQADNNSDIFMGKIDFVSNARCEVIINAASESAIATALGGSVLYAFAGKNRVQLTVVAVEGRLIRCSFKCGNKINVIPAEGADAFYSMNDNSASGYSDVKVMLSGLIKLYEDFIIKVESTDDPARLAAVVDEFSVSMECIIPEMDRLNRKYPELRDFMGSPPPELKGEVELIRKLEPGLNDAFFKIKMYEKNSDVGNALRRLKSVLDKMYGRGEK